MKLAIGVALKAVDQVTGPVRGMTGNVTRALRQIENVSERTSGRFKKMGGGIRGFISSPLGGIMAAGAAYLTYDRLAGAYSACTAAAGEAIAAESRMQALMRNNPKMTAPAIRGLSEYADKLMMKTGVDDEALKVSGGQLSVYQLSEASIRKLLPAVVELATSQYGLNVGQEQMLDTTKRLGKALLGNGGRALKGFGIGLTAAQEKLLKTGTESQRVELLLGKITNRFKGLRAALMKTAAGRNLLLGVQVSEMEEDIGKRLLPVRKRFLELALSVMPAVTSAVTKAAPYVEKLVRWILQGVEATVKWAKEHPRLAANLGKVMAVMVMAVALAGPLGRVIGIVMAVGRAIAFVRTVMMAGGVMSVLTNPIFLIITAIAVAAYLIYRNWKPVKGFFIGVWTATVGAFRWAWKTINRLLDNPIARVLMLMFAPMITIPILIIRNWKTIKSFFAGLWQFLADKFLAAWRLIRPGLMLLMKGAQWVGGVIGWGAGKAVQLGKTLAYGAPVASGRPAAMVSSHTESRHSTVTVDFRNVPQGARIRGQANQPGISLNVGYNGGHALAAR